MVLQSATCSLLSVGLIKSAQNICLKNQNIWQCHLEPINLQLWVHIWWPECVCVTCKCLKQVVEYISIWVLCWQPFKMRHSVCKEILWKFIYISTSSRIFSSKIILKCILLKVYIRNYYLIIILAITINSYLLSSFILL